MILIARLSALGDVAMTIPPIYDLCRAMPQRQFLMLTRNHPAQLFVNPPDNLTVLPVNTDNYKGIGGIWRLYRNLTSSYDITAFADLHDVLRTKLLRLFFRICHPLPSFRIRHIEKGRRDRKALTRPKGKKLRPLLPMQTRYARVLTDTLRLPDPAPSTFNSVYQEIPADPGLFATVCAPKSEGERWLAIAPFAKHRGKIYPENLMTEVIGMLRPHYSKIFIFGFGDEEKAAIQRMAAASDSQSLKTNQENNIVNMAARKIGLKAEMALIHYCDAMLSMDSANMHIASLAGTRTVSIWGATHPFCGFAPHSLKAADTIQQDLPCRPCSIYGQRPCALHQMQYRCLTDITPESIASRLIPN